MDTQQIFQMEVDKDNCPNWIRCNSMVIKSYLELMSQRAEMFEMTFAKEQVQLSSYTTGIYSSENTMLKQPFNTKVMMRIEEIDAMAVGEHMSLGFRLKEFRIFISLLESLVPAAIFEAYFYEPGAPILFLLANEPLDVSAMLPLPHHIGDRGRALPLGSEVSFVFLTTGSRNEAGADNSMIQASHVSNDSFTVSRNTSIIKRGIRRPTVSTITTSDSIASSFTRNQDSITSSATQSDSFIRQQPEDHPGDRATIIDRYTPSHPNGDEDYENELRDHQPSVIWNVDEDDDQIMNQQQPIPDGAFTAESSLFVYQEDDEEEADLDAQLLTFASQLDAIGPTQNKSQARGLFDD